MNTRKSSYIAIALTIGLAAPTFAEARCSKKDLKGTWYVYGMSGDVVSGAFGETDECKVTVNSSGKISNSGSACRYRNAMGTGVANITGGNMKTKSSCKITAKVNFCNKFGCSSFILDRGRLAKDKRTFSAIGYANYDRNVVFHTTGVKGR